MLSRNKWRDSWHKDTSDSFFFKKDPSLDGDGGEVRQQKLALSEVLVILGGSSTNIGVTSNKRTRLRDQILITMD
jgi:hypothetical protein